MPEPSVRHALFCLTQDEVGDLEMWALTFRTSAEEFSQFVATLSGRLEELQEAEAELEAEGEDPPRPGWRQRLKEGLAKPPDQDDAP